MIAQTTIAMELDEFYTPGNPLKKLLALPHTIMQLVDASGVYLHCNFVIAPATTTDDAAWFERNRQRAYGLRPANADEFVSRGRETAEPFVVIRQIRPGARFICGIPDDAVLDGDVVDLAPDWYDDDDVLALLFEFLCQLPGKPFSPLKLIAAAKELKWKRGTTGKPS